MKKGLGILFFLILEASKLWAQEKFTAIASKTNVKVGEYFVIDFSINTYGKKFTPPDLSKFRILAGPSTSGNKIVLNGDTVFKNIFTSYIVSVTKEGIYNIDTASTVTNGHTRLLFSPLKITVKGQLTPEERTRQYTDQETNMPHWDFETVDIKNISKQVFIKAKADKNHSYVGEPIKVAYSLYFRISIVGVASLNKIPDFNGFRVQKALDTNTRKSAGTTENVNGKVYNVAGLMQRVVYPQHTGDITIAPFTLKTLLWGPPKVDSDKFFGYGQPFEYDVKSDPVIIHVRALSKSKKTTRS